MHVKLKPCDVLYPPPAYDELDLLPAITQQQQRQQQQRQQQQQQQQQQRRPLSPHLRLAFVEVSGAAPAPRRSSAPSSSSSSSSGPSDPDAIRPCPVGVHRHSIAVIEDETLPCGLVRPPTQEIRVPNQPN